MWLELRNVGRFESASLNADARVIALLGANEAGKTTTLRALRELNHDEPITDRLSTRGASPSTEPPIEAWFLLDKNERERLTADVPEARDSRWYVLKKAQDGSRNHHLVPLPKRDLSRRSGVAKDIDRLLGMKWTGGEEQKGLHEELGTAGGILGSGDRSLDNEQIDQLSSVLDALQKDDERAPKHREVLVNRLSSLLEYERADHPASHAVEIAGGWQPSLLMFESQERSLDSEYDLTAIADDPPAALKNLASVSGLSLPQLRDASTSGRPEVVEDLLARANVALADVFRDAWGQSRVEVRFATDAALLHVLVRADEGALQRIAERSDGLRIFVALVAFLVAHRAERPILLIDEAEQHLHWDAQADLVGMLHRQERAAQVIYTTHSPGCLPQDLGTGVRLVSAVAGHPDRSSVVNSLWTAGHGFVPLLLGIGASTAAITPARRALIAEGATEFLLLPALLRESIDADYLEFQVVPGLAEAGDMELANLDLAAARVAYFTDGDEGGKQLRRQLRSQGVPPERIVSLPTGLVIEDLVDPGALQAGIEEELRRSGKDTAPMFAAPSLPKRGRAGWIDEQLASVGLKAPSKPAVAARVLEWGSPKTKSDGRRSALLDDARRGVAREILGKIHAALDVV